MLFPSRSGFLVTRLEIRFSHFTDPLIGTPFSSLVLGAFCLLAGISCSSSFSDSAFFSSSVCSIASSSLDSIFFILGSFCSFSAVVVPLLAGSLALYHPLMTQCQLPSFSILVLFPFLLFSLPLLFCSFLPFSLVLADFCCCYTGVLLPRCFAMLRPALIKLSSSPSLARLKWCVLIGLPLFL